MKKSSTRVRYADLQGDFQSKNIFSTVLQESGFNGITLPPKTTLTLREENNEWQILLKNKYCEIILGIQFALGNERFELEDAPVRFSYEERRNEFATFDFFITMEVKFSRFWSWALHMNDYYEWTEGMLERLRDDFDWRVQVRKIREVLETLDSRHITL
jgi:hypothetical protein